jgi:hypothetical protein
MAKKPLQLFSASLQNSSLNVVLQKSLQRRHSAATTWFCGLYLATL